MKHTCSGELRRTSIPPDTNPKTKQALWINPCEQLPFETLPKQLGAGRYGTVFQAHCGDQSQFAVKWIPASNVRQFDKEIMLQNSAAPQFARPIYEKWECREKYETKYGYVMDRLDVTLYTDLYKLSSEQEEQFKQNYTRIFTILIETDKEWRTSENMLSKELIHKMTNVMSLSVSACEALYDLVCTELYKLYEVDIVPTYGKPRNNNPYEIEVPISEIYDTLEQKRKKCFQFLLAMNCLDGLQNINILHNDCHPSNIMRKKDEERYYMIDFGRATTFVWDDTFDPSEHPDLEFLFQFIQEKIKKTRDYPVRHDVSYLEYIYHSLKSIVTFEYHINEDLYKEYVHDFDTIFETEIVIPEQKRQELLLQRQAATSAAAIVTKDGFFGKKKKQKNKEKNKEKNKQKRTIKRRLSKRMVVKRKKSYTRNYKY
jgi:serine/threonine protein kinase